MVTSMAVARHTLSRKPGSSAPPAVSTIPLSMTSPPGSRGMSCNWSLMTARILATHGSTNACLAEGPIPSYGSSFSRHSVISDKRAGFFPDAHLLEDTFGLTPGDIDTLPACFRKVPQPILMAHEWSILFPLMIAQSVTPSPPSMIM